MNTSEMMRILDSIARDRNVDKGLLISDLETAMVSACRKFFGTLDAEEFQCSVDPLTGEIKLFRYEQPLDMDPADFGRIAAQTFKQVMIQRFRDDERQSLMEEYSGRVGTLVTGVAQRYDRGALVVQVDRAETVMLRSEQIPGEQFMPNDRVRAMILDVKDMGSQVKIYLSRAHPDFIRRLFEVEVPEVMERTIEIKAMSREAGYRTKMAVSSIDSKIDAVGACVGIRGSRIKTIVDELNGEKIDIVRWNESSQILIANALKPAEVNEISLCFELGRATVVVRDDQLSLAIGKRGQNVRLAARLTGWDVDILTPEEFTKGLTILSETLKQIEGVTDEMIDRLAALGMISVFDIEEIGEDVLITELELDQEKAAIAVEMCAARAKEVAAEQEKEKAESAARKAQEEQAAAAILSGGSTGDTSPEVAAAAILGAAAAEASEGEGSEDEQGTVEPDKESENRAANILGGDA
ncbi:MAG: transcription termination factor NusA [Phycisphaerales bacterium]